MIRSFNYTGRSKITRQCTSFSVDETGGGVRTFDAELQLADLDLPGDARVFVEAYHRHSIMRFDFGTVATLTPPPRAQRELSNVAHDAPVYFRVKVVDQSGAHGRLIAIADQVTPADSTDAGAGRAPLLPVRRTDDLGQRIWMIEYDSGHPVLLVNSQIPGVRALVSTDAGFYPVVLANIFREVLIRALLVDRYNYLEEDDNWMERWTRFAATYAAEEPPEWDEDSEEQSRRERTDWIERAVNEFAAERQLTERFLESQEGRRS